MKSVILTPWRPGSKDREEALEYVLRHYARSGIPHVLGDGDTPTFSRTAARNRAAEKAGDWDAAAFVDADCIIPIKMLEMALEMAYRRNQVILPHDHYWPLTRLGTVQAMLEPNLANWDESWCEDNHHRKRPSGVIVFPRRVWEDVQGYDERFEGWGFEDNAMLWAVDALSTGWLRLAGKLWHLWHPTAKHTWLPSDKALFERYKAASGDYARMRALLVERTEVRLPA